jgi:hypothetical protein
MSDYYVNVTMPKELAEWWAGYDIDDVAVDKLMYDTREACRKALPNTPIRPRQNISRG